MVGLRDCAGPHKASSRVFELDHLLIEYYAVWDTKYASDLIFLLVHQHSYYTSRMVLVVVHISCQDCCCYLLNEYYGVYHGLVKPLQETSFFDFLGDCCWA